MISPLREHRELRYPEWQKPLQAALLELDREKLQQRIAEAEEALLRRQQALMEDAVNHSTERAAITDGLSSLRSLRKYTGAESAK
jgi:hypothetical protein